VAGVPVSSWSELANLPFEATSVPQVLEMRAAGSGSRLFVSDFAGDSMTYRQAQARAKRLATGFRDLGVGRGDVVALWMFNSCDLVACMFALGYLGAAGAAVNTDYKGEMLAYVMNDLGANVAVVDAELMEVFGEASAAFDQFGVDKPGTVVVRGEWDRALFGGVTTGFDVLGSAGELGEIEATCQSDLFMVNYTSGSTGPSKGILFPNGQVLVMGYDWSTIMSFGEQDVLYAPLPLFHTLGMILGVMATLVTGASVHLDRKFSASQFWSRAKACNATLAQAVRATIVLLYRKPPAPHDKDHRLRKIWSILASLSDEFYERFGVRTPELYGQSETGLVSYSADSRDAPAGSCGWPSPRFDIAIVDGDDNPVEPGTPGEIVVRPRVPYTMMMGYMGKAEKSLESFRNLWHHTGDLVRQDEDGWLYFVGRAKDMIRRRSQNISAHDIELVLGTYPGLDSIAAYAVPADFGDEEIKVALVGAKTIEFEMTGFLAFCRDKLPKMMVPRYVEVIDEMPVTGNQKIAKYQLKESGILGITGKTYDVEAGAYVSAS
jgi:carnitine-CoA ligase